MARKAIVVQGYYKKNGDYVQPHTKWVETGDGDRESNFRENAASTLDAISELGEDDQDYSDHIAEYSADITVRDSEFGPNGVVNNTNRWVPAPEVHGAEINGVVTFRDEGAIDGGRYDGEAEVLKSKLQDSTVETGAKAEVLGSNWSEVRVDTGSDVFSQGTRMSNVNVDSGVLRFESFGLHGQPLTATNCVIRGVKSKSALIMGDDATLDRSDVRLGGGSALSLARIEVTDSVMKIPANRAVIMSPVGGALGDEIRVSDTKLLKNEDTLISGMPAGRSCMAVAHEMEGVRNPTREDFDTVYVFSGTDTYKMTRGTDGNYEVAGHSTLRGWADGMSLDKAKGRLSKIAADYTKSFGR